MSQIDIKSFFKLGLDSTDDAGEEAGLINTIRTPVDTQSRQLNRVTFKVPKIGMLTADSHINLRFTTTKNNVGLNILNGALGAIQRFRVLVGNRVLTDIERPALMENVKLYSARTLTHLMDFERKFLGNSFNLETDKDDGNFILGDYGNAVVDDAGDVKMQQQILNANGEGKTYAIPLKMLGASFLETASLPVFLLGSREMIIEITFEDDCRQYAIQEQITAKDDVKVDLVNVELISTHVMLNEQTESDQMAGLSKSAAQYPLIDTYLIKAVLPAGVNGTKATNLYRLNIQNREVHRVLMAYPLLVGSHNDFLANQASDAVGDEVLQVKANGLNIFERPVTNAATIYQLLNYYNGGLSLKVPNQVFNGTKYAMEALSHNADYADLLGTQHYVGLDFKNGNNGIQGSGTVMTSALEVEYSNTPNNDSGRGNQALAHDVFFYVSYSKMLTIGQNMINVSF